MQGLFLDLYFSCSFHLCLIKVNKTRRIICLLSGVPHLNTTVWGLRGVPQKSHASQYGGLIWRILLPPGRSPWRCSQKPCSRYSTSTNFNKMVTYNSRTAGLFCYHGAKWKRPMKLRLWQYDWHFFNPKDRYLTWMKKPQMSQKTAANRERCK